MLKAIAAFLLLSTAAFAQDKPIEPSALQDCPLIGQSAKGELIYEWTARRSSQRTAWKCFRGCRRQTFQTQLSQNQVANKTPMTRRQKGETR